MKKFGSIVAATLLSTTMAFAATMGDDKNLAVDANADGVADAVIATTGDYSVVPAYYANTAGWSTTFKVTNTDLANAVIAKVVVRESVDSVEVLDYLIYLTPGDVYEATIYNDGGAVKVKSTDDSQIIAGVTGDTKTFDEAVTMTAGQDATSGYVEVMGVAKASAAALDATWVANQPLSKATLYNAWRNVGANAAGTWVDVADDLYVTETVNNATAGSELSLSVPTVTFNNFATAPMIAVTGSLGTTLANSTNRNNAQLLAEMNSLLTTNTAFVNYSSNGSAVNETALYVTAPTKKYVYETSGAAGLVAIGYTQLAGTAGTKTSDFAAAWTLTARDMKENTPQAPVAGELSGKPAAVVTRSAINKELDVVRVSGDANVANYKDGYAAVTLNNTPVITTLMSATTVGTRAITAASTPATK